MKNSKTDLVDNAKIKPPQRINEPTNEYPTRQTQLDGNLLSTREKSALANTVVDGEISI